MELFFTTKFFTCRFYFYVLFSLSTFLFFVQYPMPRLHTNEDVMENAKKICDIVKGIHQKIHHNIKNTPQHQKIHHNATQHNTTQH